MSEHSSSYPPYQMETALIPAGVDLTLAGRRTALIEQYRSGETDAAATYRNLEHLYWSTQPHADDITRGYLRETAYSFPVEANMDEDEVDAIFVKVQNEY